jgi:hypothetical protein
MTWLWELAAGAGFATAIGFLLPAGVWRRLAVPNRRGALVSAALGIPVAAATVALAWVGDLADAARGRPLDGAIWLASATTLVFLIGLADDLARSGPRGLRGHAAALVRGRLSTGQLKLIGIPGAAFLAAWAVAAHRDPARLVASVILIAGAANVFNGLDVAPGRAIKAFLLAAVPLDLLITPPWATFLRATGAAAAVLWLDLRERAMLGDSGSNLLGFFLGVVLVSVWTGSAVGLWVAAGVAVALNGLAETVSFSRIIRSTPPLRWFDGLGRLPDPEPEDADGPPAAG